MYRSSRTLLRLTAYLAEIVRGSSGQHRDGIRVSASVAEKDDATLP